MTSDFGWMSDGTPDRAKVEWVVEAPGGTRWRRDDQASAAGVLRSEITLQ